MLARFGHGGSGDDTATQRMLLLEIISEHRPLANVAENKVTRGVGDSYGHADADQRVRLPACSVL